MTDHGRYGCVAVLTAAVALIAPVRAGAEERMTVKGDALRGLVTDLTSDGVTLEPIYGEGSIVVPWKDVQTLESDDTFEVLYGDEEEAHGRLLGVRDGKLSVGDTPETATSVDVTTLFHARNETGADPSLLDRLRNRYRFWTTTLDAAAGYTDSTTDQVFGRLGLFIQRKKDPTLFFFEGAIRYANEKEQGDDRSITENNMYGLLRGEYSFTEHIYSYASTRATHDTADHLSVRAEPRAGVGYYFIKSKKRNFSADVGGGWVYEDYFGDEGTFPFEFDRGSDNFFTIVFGVQGDAELPYGVLWRGRAEYLPAVDNWADDYLTRAETSLDFPLLEWLAFRAACSDEYDNSPAPGAQRNKFIATVGLALRFP